MLDPKYLLRAVCPASDRLDTAADSTDAWASSIPLIPVPERDEPSTNALNDPAVLVCSLPPQPNRPRRFSISARAVANFRACFSQMARMAFPYMSCIQAYLVSKAFQEDLECSSTVSFCGTIRDGAWRRQVRMISSNARVVYELIE